MYKDNFDRTTLIKAHVAQSVEHQAWNLEGVDSIPTVSKNISVSICFRRVPDGRSTGPIQMKPIMTFIRGI